MITGSPAVTVRLWMRASGVRLWVFSFADDEYAGGAVADLAGVGGADDAAFLQQFYGGDAFEGCGAADAFVGFVD
jgi:hypothetical protein